MWNLKAYNEVFISLLYKIPLAYLAFWMDILFMYEFVILYFGHLKNIGLLNYTDIHNYDWLHYKIPKIHIVNITKSLIKKNLMIAELSSSRWQTQVFQNYNFHLKGRILSLVTNIICYSFLKVTSLIHLFVRQHLPNIHLWITVVCLSIGIS